MTGWLLAAPALLVMALAFLWPMAGLFRISLNRTTETGAMEVALTTDSYSKLLGDDFTRELVLNTLVLAGSSAAIAVALALPVALMVRAASPRWRGLLALAAIAPLLISGTARLVGWMAILGDNGMINAVLLGLGLRAIGVADTHGHLVRQLFRLHAGQVFRRGRD